MKPTPEEEIQAKAATEKAKKVEAKIVKTWQDKVNSQLKSLQDQVDGMNKALNKVSGRMGL